MADNLVVQRPTRFTVDVDPYFGHRPPPTAEIEKALEGIEPTTSVVGGESAESPAIDKAILLDENDKPLSPAAGVTTDLKATQGETVSAGNPPAARGADAATTLIWSWQWPDGSVRRIGEATYKLCTERGWGAREQQQLIGAISKCVAESVEAWVTTAAQKEIAKTAESGGHLDEIEYSSAPAVVITAAIEWAVADLERLNPVLAVEYRAKSAGGEAAASSGLDVVQLLEVMGQLAPAPDLSKLTTKLDEIADRPQEITVDVHLDEERLGQAIARAMKPKSDVEFLAWAESGKPALLRRADGTVVKFEYDQDGQVQAMRNVDNVEFELARLNIAAAKASTKTAPYREMLKSQDTQLAASARRVLQTKGERG